MEALWRQESTLLSWSQLRDNLTHRYRTPEPLTSSSDNADGERGEIPEVGVHLGMPQPEGRVPTLKNDRYAAKLGRPEFPKKYTFTLRLLVYYHGIC